MPSEKSEHCPFFETYEGSTFQKFISVDENGDVKYSMFEVDSMSAATPSCTSDLVKSINEAVSEICLGTAEAICQGNFEKCKGYNETIEDNNKRLEALANLIKEGKTNANVLLQNRLTPGFQYLPEKKHPDINSDIEVTEDEERYYIKISAEDKSPIFVVLKKSGMIYMDDEKSRNEAKSLGIYGLGEPLFVTINSIIEQMSA